MYRLGRAAFTPLIGLIAAALLLTRFDFPFLAARAYIDIPYLAFVVWAAALEVERPRRGMPVLISISNPAPYWATTQPALRNSVWAPKASELADFAYAVALRYRAVADEFALLNEPNQGAWLQPQSLHGKPVAPFVYAGLVRAAYPAVKAAAPNSVVLVGVTIRDAVILVDVYERRRLAGEALEQLIVEGTLERTTQVVVTSVASIAAPEPAPAVAAPAGHAAHPTAAVAHSPARKPPPPPRPCRPEATHDCMR